MKRFRTASYNSKQSFRKSEYERRLWSIKDNKLLYYHDKYLKWTLRYNKYFLRLERETLYRGRYREYIWLKG